MINLLLSKQYLKPFSNPLLVQKELYLGYIVTSLLKMGVERTKLSF